MRRLLLPALLLAAVASAAAQTTAAPPKRPLRSSDLFRLRSVSDPQRSPDGAWVAYTVSRADSAKDRSDTDIWMTRWDGTATVRLTFTEESESQPRWSPDGKTLSFVSSRQGAKGGQVWLLNIGIGGEAEKITDLKGGVSSVAWSPDGKRLALIVNDPDPAADSSNAKPKPIVVDKYQFKQDGQGFLGPLHSHIWVLDLATRQAEQITKGDADDGGAAWSPDGRWIAFISAREPDAERYDNDDVYVVEAMKDATPRRLTAFQGSDGGPLSWSPDGSQVAYRQQQEPKFFGYGGGFGTVAFAPVAGGTTRLVTAGFDRVISTSRWSLDGKSLLGLVADDQRQYLARINPSSGAVERIPATMPAINGFSEGRDGASPKHYGRSGLAVRRPVHEAGSREAHRGRGVHYPPDHRHAGAGGPPHQLRRFGGGRVLAQGGRRVGVRVYRVVAGGADGRRGGS